MHCILGEVLLIGIENKKTLNVKDARTEITCLAWVQEKVETKLKDTFTLKEEPPKNYMKYIVSFCEILKLFAGIFYLKYYRTYQNYI